MLLAIMELSSCSTPPPQVSVITEVVKETVLVTQIVPEVITATPVPPTFTPTATLATPTASLSITPTGTVDVFTSWCTEWVDELVDGKQAQPWIMPAQGATAGKTVYDYTVLTFPAVSCTIVFNFGAPLPADTKLELYDMWATHDPWLTVPLLFTDTDPNIAYAVLTHTYITSAPAYDVKYVFKVRTPDSTEKWERIMLFSRGWHPRNRCWNGDWPDLETQKCPILPELEPQHEWFWIIRQTKSPDWYDYSAPDAGPTLEAEW